MPLRKLKPVTQTSRGTSYLDFSNLTKGRKNLRRIKKKNSGRNSSGKITVAHRGGGSKRFYRVVSFNFRSDKPAKVVAIEYDPNRGANIARIKFDDDHEEYILAPEKIKIGTQIVSGEKAGIKIGNRLALKNIPIGTQIHNIELLPGMGGKLCRAAGNYATTLGVESGFAQIKLPSGEVRKVAESCMASIGAVGNSDRANLRFGKAGRRRWLGVRPSVRGKAKNVVDHPHGGGEGGTSIGLPSPKTPWGVPALGFRTRNQKKKSKKFIVSRRS